MESNNKKFNVMHVSRTHLNPRTYHTKNVSLDFIMSFKYFGAHITTNLTWTFHVEYVINIASIYGVNVPKYHLV